jgi:predicted small lipoprotein YifL
MIRASLLALGACALVLAACGRVGPLDQPAPLYGAKAKADYKAQKAKEADAAKAPKEDDTPEPLASDTPGPNNPGATPDNLRADPAPGMRPLPNGPGPQGVLPDPYNRPQ